MNSTLLGLVALFGAVLGGAVGAFVTVQMTEPKVATSADTAKAREASSDDDATDQEEADEEVQALRTRVRGLETRVALLGLGHRAAGRGGAGALDEAGGAGSQPEPSDPAFELAVRDVLDRVETEKDGERGRRREDFRRERGVRAVQALSDTLGLTDEQKTQFEQISERQSTAMRALREEMQATPALRSERRERIKQLREQAETEVRQLLDPTQLQKYEALDEGDRLGAFRGNRGGGPDRRRGVGGGRGGPQ